jgi:hypothetical protein
VNLSPSLSISAWEELKTSVLGQQLSTEVQTSRLAYINQLSHACLSLCRYKMYSKEERLTMYTNLTSTVNVLVP